MRDTVDEMRPGGRGRGHRRRAHKGGTIALARTPAQLARRADEVATARAWGFATRTTCGCSTPARPRRGSRPADVLGGDVHPGLRGGAPRPAGARAGPRGRGGAAARSTSGPGCARSSPAASETDARHGARRGRGAGHRGLHAAARRAAPRRRAGLLADGGHRAAARRASGTQIGLRERETFTDHRHLIIYGQRTADGRLVFGGRGAPYHFGSRDPARLRPRAAGLRRAAARCASCSRSWPTARVHPRVGRRLGITRDWVASVGLDRATGIGWAGGYVGDGVGHDEPGRPHAAPTWSRSRHRAGHAALGRAPLAAGGSRSRCAGWASTRGCAR